MDASEGQRFLHARSANEIDRDDEHWLWSHVGRIKRSIQSVLGNENEHLNKRKKRDWAWPWEDESASETTEEPTTKEPTTASSFNLFNPFGFNNDEKVTTQSPEEDYHHQSDESTEDENLINQEELDIDLTEGSGSSKDDEVGDIESQYCKLHIFRLFNN